MFLLDAAVVCSTNTCKATIPWALGIKEFAVFSVDKGIATLVGEIKYIYK